MNETTKLVKCYVTKYALTTGILELDCEISEDQPTMITHHQDIFPPRVHYHGKDWYLNREDAVARAKEMKEKKLQSLQRSMDKINALVFE